MVKLQEIYKKYVRDRLFVKLIIIYSVILCTTLMVSNIYIMESYVKSLKRDQMTSQYDILNVVKHNVDKKFKSIQSLITQIHYVDFNGYTIAESLLLPSDNPIVQRNIDYFLQEATRKDTNILDFLILQKYDKKVYHKSVYDRSLAISFNLFSSNMVDSLRDQEPGSVFLVDNTYSYILSNEQNTVLTMKGNIYDLQNMMFKKIVGHYIVNISQEVLLESLKNYIGNFKGYILVADENRNLLLSSNSNGEHIDMNKLFAADNQSTVSLDEEVVVLRTQLPSLGWEFFNVISVENIAYEVEILRKRLLYIIFAVTLFSMLILVFVSRIFTKRMRLLMRSMRSEWRDIPSIDYEYIDHNHDEIGQVSRAFSQLNVRLKGYIDRVYVAEIQKKDAELQMLQHKINPHFLFNTLEAIRMKAIQGGQSEVSDMIAVLGHLFRWNIKGNGMFVQLEEEVDYIQSYLSLIKLRYRDRIEITYHIPEELLNFGIPKITLQPIVENAVKYGVDLKSKGINQINIYGHVEGKRLSLCIQDNGVGIESDNLNLIQQSLDQEQLQSGNSGMGLANVHQRLRRLFGSEFGLDIDSNPGEGTTVTVRLPARTVKELNKDV